MGQGGRGDICQMPNILKIGLKWRCTGVVVSMLAGFQSDQQKILSCVKQLTILTQFCILIYFFHFFFFLSASSKEPLCKQKVQM